DGIVEAAPPSANLCGSFRDRAHGVRRRRWGLIPGGGRRGCPRRPVRGHSGGGAHEIRPDGAGGKQDRGETGDRVWRRYVTLVFHGAHCMRWLNIHDAAPRVTAESSASGQRSAVSKSSPAPSRYTRLVISIA